MEGRTLVFAAILIIVSSILIATSDCSPVITEREKRTNLVETSPIIAETKMTKEKINRQGRYYMGYPYGGLGYGGGGAVASASASASASSGGFGMGYGGYPHMYGK